MHWTSTNHHAAQGAKHHIAAAQSQCLRIEASRDPELTLVIMTDVLVEELTLVIMTDVLVELIRRLSQMSHPANSAVSDSGAMVCSVVFDGFLKGHK